MTYRVIAAPTAARLCAQEGRQRVAHPFGMLSHLVAVLRLLAPHGRAGWVVRAGSLAG